MQCIYVLRIKMQKKASNWSEAKEKRVKGGKEALTKML